MRIFEIDDSNLIWAKFNNINLSIEGDYRSCNSIINLLLKNNTAIMNHKLLPSIEICEQRINTVINSEFTNESDPDIIELKSKAITYLSDIHKMKSKLKL